MQVIFVLIYSLFSVIAVAQEEASETTLPIEEVVQETKTLKKIEVTGSYIKRVDEEAPNPVQTITSETLKKSGYNSVADVLRDNAVTTGGAREDSSSSNPGVATTGIGPFGSDSILVLLDGNRMPKIGGGNSVDLNLIPMAAIERVEVLKDGASAIYGSDAIGGVINFITKKNYDGGTVTLGQSVAQAGGAARTDFNATFGKTFKKGSITAILQARNNGELASADREYLKVRDLKNQGSFNSQIGQWAGANGTGNQFVPGSCPPEQVVTIDGRTYCMFDFSKYAWEMPKISQYSMLLNGQYQISSNLRSKTQVNATYRDVQTKMAPAPGKIRLTAAQAQAVGITNPLVFNDTVELNLRTLDAGTRDTTDQTFSYNANQTFEGKIAGTWNWDLTGSYADSRRRNDGRGYANAETLKNLILSGDYRPLVAPGQQGSMAAALFNPYEVETSRQAEARALASGQLADSVSMAIGAASGWQMYSTEVDNVTANNNNFGGIGGNGKGTRSSNAVFTEASIFPVESVEVGLAARLDNYSDFGNTFNPKLSLSWQASDKLMLRSSVGTGFRAPNLSDIHNGGYMSYPPFKDTIGCANIGGPTCSNRQYEVNYRANQSLTQEKSLFWNAGFLLAPKKNWNIESNLFIAQIEDSVGGLSMNQVMRAASRFGEDFLRERYQIDIVRNGGLITQVNMLSAYNLSTTTNQGIDFHIANQSKFRLGGGTFDVVTDITHIQFLKVEGETIPGLGLQNSQDNYFKNTASVTVSKNKHAVRSTMRTISSGDMAGNIGDIGDVGYGSLRTHTEFDLNYNKRQVFKNINLNIGVKNVFDTPRPLDNTAQVALNSSIYDPIGRYYYTTLDYAF